MASPLDASALEKARSLSILDDAGNAVAFGTLFENQKAIVVFIRAFDQMRGG